MGNSRERQGRQISLIDRYRGALLGLACGDAVGTTVEFRARGSFPRVTDMVGGGPFDLKPGQWTDDTSMALCLAESLVRKGAFDPADQMTRYVNWWTWGYYSSTGECFDIGSTVRRALERFQQTGEPFAGSTDPYSAGNGSLMRLAPVVLFGFPEEDRIAQLAGDSSRTTHGASEAVECCRLFGVLLGKALRGEPKNNLKESSSLRLTEAAVISIAEASYLHKRVQDICGSGYCVASLEAALWCFHQTATFEDAVLEAANLGDDADTTGAIVGQIAGAHYGVEAIPTRWREKLSHVGEIDGLARALHELATTRVRVVPDVNV
ncbi:MAG: ADP-ribosylglycohydrolase family protein [Steroidobacteraceae bacterium]